VAKTSTETIELPAKGQEPTATVETDHTDETRLGSFVGFGVVEARFSGDTLANVIYPPVPGQRRYQVDPVAGTIVGRIA
jgi:hypothetical protein